MKWKQLLSGFVAAAMLSTMSVGFPGVSAAETLPEPDYLFTFEQVAGADPGGKQRQYHRRRFFGGQRPQVVSDPEVPTTADSSQVLQLNGDGPGSSYLRLPDGIFSQANGSDGVTLTMWVKPSTASHRLYAAVCR